jgi:hypothetical protein
MSINQLVLTYGFECENIILFTCKSNICKSFVTGNPVYSSIMIKDKNMKVIINKMKKIENNHEFYLSFIDDMALIKNIKPKWQLVLYNKDFNNYVRGLQGHSLLIDFDRF